MDIYSSLFIKIYNKLCKGYRKERQMDLFSDIHVKQ